MNSLADNLARVIDRWSGLETGALTRDTVLKNLWDRRHLGTIPYSPDGIDRLIDRIQNDSFFQTNQQAGQLERGMFVDGGGIQTEGELHDFLNSF